MLRNVNSYSYGVCGRVRKIKFIIMNIFSYDYYIIFIHDKLRKGKDLSFVSLTQIKSGNFLKVRRKF